MKWSTCKLPVTIYQTEERGYHDTQHQYHTATVQVPYWYEMIARTYNGRFEYGIVKLKLRPKQNGRFHHYVDLNYKAKSHEDVSIWYDLVINYDNKWYVIGRVLSKDEDNNDGRTVLKDGAELFDSTYTVIEPFQDNIEATYYDSNMGRVVTDVVSVTGIQMQSGKYRTRSWKYYIDGVHTE